MSLLAELKRRNVVRVAVAYGVLSWLLIQVADTLTDTLGLPEWTGKLVVLLLLLGLLPTLIFSWVYELTPEGLKKESEVTPEESVTVHTARRLDVAVIILLVMAIGLFAVDRFGPAETNSPPPVAAAEATVEAPAASSSPQQAELPAAEPGRRSIAVLPFTNRSTESDTVLFVDGIHDDLLTQLAKISALKVISRTSVLEYRDTTKNLREIGQELGVTTIMEGAVQRAGDRVRINAQLIDADSDEHLWAETYDRELTADGIFELQSEIAKAIASALEATLSPEEEAEIGRKLTDNIEALAAYQRARNIAEGLFSPEKVEYELRRALELDPEFVAAWAMLARTYLNRWWLESRDEGLRDQAMEAIEHGRALDPEAVELHVAEGYYRYWGFRDYPGALELLEPALEDRPNDADLHELLGYVHRRAGNFDAALAYFEAALELNPRSIDVLSSLGETYVYLRELDRAEWYVVRTAELAPTSSRAYQWMGRLDIARGEQARGVARLRLGGAEARLLWGEYWDSQVAAGKFEQALQDAGFEFIDQRGVVIDPLNRALVHAYLGDLESARPLAETALVRIRAGLAERPGYFGYLKAQCQALAALGDRSATIQACETAIDNLYDDAFDRQHALYDLAMPFALVGANERALEILEGILKAPVGPTRIQMQQDARLTSLHGGPGWKKLFAEDAP
jgi:TolB-like protein